MSELSWPIVGFSTEAAAQASALFARENGGKIEVLKLMKLMYLSERESVRVRGRLMFNDEHYSLPHGPICSGVLNGINGRSERPIWKQYVVRERQIVSSLSDDTDYLSRSDMQIIRQVWVTYGWMSVSQIRNWTHENCDEYTELNSGRMRISISEMAEAVGIDAPEVVAENLQVIRNRAAALS